MKYIRNVSIPFAPQISHESFTTITFSEMPLVPFTCFLKVALPHQLTKWEDYWLQIQGFWLTLSKKINSPGHFFLPLDISHIDSAESETNNQNSIYFETSPESGCHRLYLSSMSRLEMIETFKAINAGASLFKSVYDSYTEIGNIECEYQVSSGFMNLTRERRKLVLSADRLMASDSKQFPLAKISSVCGKQGDPNCSSKLVVTVTGPDGITQKEFAGMAVQDLKKMCWAFLMRAKTRNVVSEKRPREPLC
jgi:hypothetical protein